MEAYQTGNTTCTSAVLAFLGAWTARLHDQGYLSAVYSSISSGVTDLVNDYNSTSRPRPDYLYFARYDGVASTDNPAIPAADWSPHRRMHQYAGGHDETWGGVTINIDNDYVDVAPPPNPVFGDFTGNGWSDLIARETTGDLYLYPGNGTNLGTRTRIGTGWNNFAAITRFGDFTRDGHEDLITRDSGTGLLWLYPGTGSGLGTRIGIGSSWNNMREITEVGDLDGDGNPDLVAVQSSTGYLLFYPGHQTSLGASIRIGNGWNVMSELSGIGDLTGDGHPDLLARNSAGVLYLYPSRGAGLGASIKVGTGWNTMRSLAGVGDFNRDGHPDLMAIETSTGTLFLYRGTTNGLTTRIGLSTGLDRPHAVGVTGLAATGRRAGSPA